MNIEPGSKEWLEVRRKCVTATDAAPIMGLSPWKTRLELYHQKIDGTQTPKSPAMERGLALEPEARLAFEQMTGHFVYPEFRRNHAIEWMAASFDGINDQGVVVEIKCPQGEDHDIAVRGQIPKKYYPQLQHQMWVAGVGHCFYFSYNPDAGVKEALIPVGADWNFQEVMLQAELDFYQCLVNKTPPEPTERDCLLREDRKWLMKEEELFGAIEARKAAEEREDKARKAMIDMADGRMSRGYRLKLSPIITKGSVDYSRIEALKEIDLEQYRKPSSVRWRVDTI